MSDLAFMEIAHEIKGLHNGALVKIREHRYIEAEELYRKCLAITERISFHEGSAVTCAPRVSVPKMRRSRTGSPL